MALNSLEKVIVGFIAVILGVSLLGVVASGALGATQKTFLENELYDLEASGCIEEGTDGGTIDPSDAACNITLTNAATGWKLEDCAIAASSIRIKNTTAGTYADLTESTDYLLWSDNNIVEMLNTTDTRRGDFNDTYISYAYCGDNYLNSA